MPITEELPVFKKRIYVLLLCVLVALIYGQFLWNPIVFDDLQFFMEGGDTLDHYLSFSPFEVRWLPMASIAWTLHSMGRDVIWFRLESMLLHAATGLVLFLFLHRLFDLVLKKDMTESNIVPHAWLAFFGALFFVWHPVAVYGAAYLIERSIVMATLFSVLTLYVYMRGLTEERTGWLWGSVVLYFLAVFSKEHAVMLPAVMMALTLLLVKSPLLLWKRLLGVYIACALIAFWVALQKAGLLGSVYEIAAPEMLGSNIEHAYPLSVLTQCFLFFKYWFLWAVPNPAWMSVDMREPFASSIFSYYLAAAFAYLLYGVIGFKLLLKRTETGLLGFAMLFPWLLFATEFSTVRIQESFVLYRGYLWMPGIFAALPFLLKNFNLKRTFVMLLLVAIMLGAMAVNRLTIFSDSLLLWDDALMLVKDQHELPGVDRIYFNRGKYLTGIKRFKEALADYQMAVTLNPQFYYYHYGLAAGYMNMARYPEAIAEFDKAIQMESKFVRAYYGRGLANIEVGNIAAGIADLDNSCRLGWKSGCAKVQQIKEGK